MSSSNIETSAYAMQAFGELLAHYSVANKGDIEFDDALGWLIAYLGQYIEVYNSINSGAKIRIAELRKEDSDE